MSPKIIYLTVDTVLSDRAIPKCWQINRTSLKLLFNSFYLNGHTLERHKQNGKLEPPAKHTTWKYCSIVFISDSSKTRASFTIVTTSFYIIIKPCHLKVLLGSFFCLSHTLFFSQMCSSLFSVLMSDFCQRYERKNVRVSYKGLDRCKRRCLCSSGICSLFEWIPRQAYKTSR